VEPLGGHLWVELVGGIILARLRGACTEELLRECHRRIIALQAETDCKRIMYDSLELDRPTVEVVLTQHSMTEALRHPSVKLAIVVPNTALAYLARLAFGETNHRVFYNDVAAAILWLNER
jgi:hypothetical protein